MNTKAFPTLADNGHSQNQDGMDLRDYFAAKAMQSMIQNSALLKDQSTLPELNIFDEFSFDHAVICGVNSELIWRIQIVGLNTHGRSITLKKRTA